MVDVLLSPIRFRLPRDLYFKCLGAKRTTYDRGKMAQYAILPLCGPFYPPLCILMMVHLQIQLIIIMTLLQVSRLLLKKFLVSFCSSLLLVSPQKHDNRAPYPVILFILIFSKDHFSDIYHQIIYQ